MTAVQSNGITIEYESFGDRESPPVLLIMGLGSQLTRWRLGLIEALVDRGYFVIRFDNRDVGLSTWFDDVAADRNDAPGTPIYSLTELALDAVGLLDTLGLDSAHIVGASMGGMIAQIIAVKHPERTRTLVSIMSTPVSDGGNLAVLAPYSVPASSRDVAIENNVKLWRVLSGTGFPFDEELVRQEAARDFDRAYHPAGTGRQLLAILASGDRTSELSMVTAPTLVIHGEDDPLVDVAGGVATAAAIPGARLKLIPGMGHYIPPEFYDELASDFAEFFREGHAR
jgi:pimeloyl-ACP methyl ester carboxylesterase